MANTQGFEVVLEASEALLTKVIRGAWKSALCPEEPGDEGRIPEFMDIPAGTMIGNFVVASGHVQIPENGLAATMATDVNGVEIKLGLNVQVRIADPPVPSAELFNMTADLRAKAPVGTLPGGLDVGLLLDNLPLANVGATLTSGDPLAPILNTLFAEFVDKAYENWTSTGPIDSNFPVIPHVVEEEDVSFGAGNADATTELFNDDSDPARQIVVTRPDATHINISIPIYLRIYNIQVPLITLEDPMGIETRINILAVFDDSVPGTYTAKMSTATVTVDAIQPVSPDISGSTLEGNNYQANKTTLAFLINLDQLITSQLVAKGTTLAHDIGDFSIEVPTVAQIEETIKALFHADLEARNFIGIWTPSTGGQVEVNDVTPKALSDVLAIALNAGGGADANALANFIPPDREFAIALSAGRVIQIIDKSRDEQGLSDSQLPKRFVEDGNDVDLNSLDVFLVDGAIRMTGNVTVIDAILDSIDVDADFRADVGLHWEPNATLNAEGAQMLRHHDIGEPDVDPEESVLFWVIALIIGFLTFGLLGTIIAVVVVLIVQGIASSIGGDLALDAITGAVNGITAWPPGLSRIGRVRAVFHDPVLIDTTGLVMAGNVEVISSCESVAVVPADSGGSYTSSASSALTLAAGNTHPDASFKWTAGDGSAPVNLQNQTHTYAASGIYIAEHELRINQPGGATSRHFALVVIKNVPPTVDAGADITVNEGELVTLTGRFWDVEYPDTHESIWNFGDHQAPEEGTIQETNNPPMAMGTSTVKHSWCDNGVYTVALRVRDQNGGMTTDTLTVTVLNVPPKVDAGEEMFAYPCTVITLTGKYEDPGWCDTHVGSWNFGDCSPTQTAVVRATTDTEESGETRPLIESQVRSDIIPTVNVYRHADLYIDRRQPGVYTEAGGAGETERPPVAKGVVIGSHVYERCGTYHVVCTVIDDDGGIGQDATVVRVIYVENYDFERGYRERLLGMVANFWEPYAAPPKQSQQPATGVHMAAVSTPPEAQGGNLFFCEECIVHGGQRSQRIRLDRPSRAGIYQQVGANPGWDYQISAWYVINERTQGGVARLGIDPEGGDDPEAPGIVWAEGAERQHWAQLTVRATAAARAITIFLETEGGERGQVDACFDDVSLVPIQPFCPEGERPRPDKPPQEVMYCVDFTDLEPGTRLQSGYEKNGFKFHWHQDGQVSIIAAGPPPGQSKLTVPVMGLIVELPFPSNQVVIRLANVGGQPISIKALNSDEQVVGEASAPPAHDQLQTLEINAPGIVLLYIEGRGREGLLYQICARRDRRKEKDPKKDPKEEREKHGRGATLLQPAETFDLKAGIARSRARVEKNIRLAGKTAGRTTHTGSKD